MLNVENVGYYAQKDRVKSVKIHEYNKTMRNLCKRRLTDTKANVNIGLINDNKS